MCYLVSVEGISPSLVHVEALVNYPKPKNTHEVEIFFGLTGFFRKFIYNYSVIKARSKSGFNFGEIELNAFEVLRQNSITSPILKIYSPFNETELHCDASCQGFGGIFMQKQHDTNTFHPFMYFSRRTTSAESRYHSWNWKHLQLCTLSNGFMFTFKVIH